MSNPEFQRDISELRVLWKIPSDGLKTNEESEKWHNQHCEDSERYFDEVWLANRPKFETLRQEKKFLEVDKLKKELNDANPVNALRKSIKNLLVKYRLAPRWESPVKMYLLSNQLQGMGMFLGVVTRLELDEDNGLERLLIEINDDTTLDDVKRSWSWIKIQQNKLSYKKQKKFQPIRQFERDKMAFELNEQGKTLKEIADELGRKFEKEYEWYEISKFIQRHRGKVGMN